MLFKKGLRVALIGGCFIETYTNQVQFRMKIDIDIDIDIHIKLAHAIICLSMVNVTG